MELKLARYDIRIRIPLPPLTEQQLQEQPLQWIQKQQAMRPRVKEYANPGGAYCRFSDVDPILKAKDKRIQELEVGKG